MLYQVIDRLCQESTEGVNIFSKYAILDEEWDTIQIIMDFLLVCGLLHISLYLYQA